MTLTDQAVVSAGNFLTGALLARHLSQTEYGAYGVIIETILFLNGLQAGLIVYPMTVRGAANRTRGARTYATASVLFTLALLPLLGTAMGFSAVLAARGSNAGGWVAVGFSAAIAMLLWQLQDTLRRILFADLRPAASIPGDAVSYLGQLAILAMLWKLNRLTLPATLITIGATSAAAAVIQALQIGLTAISWKELRGFAADFWKLGRWTALSNSMGLLTGVGYFWTLRYFHGLKATAAFAAMVLPLKVANPILLGTGNVLVPAVSRGHSIGGHRAAFHSAVRYWAVAGVLILPLFAMLVIFPRISLGLLVGSQSPYLAYAPLLRLYTFAMIVYYVEYCLSGWLSGLGESRSNFHVQAVNALATLLISLPATARFGLSGLVYGSIAAAAISALAQVFVSYKFLRLALDSIRTKDHAEPSVA